MSELHNGQQVHIAASHNHLMADNEVIYTVGAINRVLGQYNINLLKDGKSVGIVPETKLIAKR